MKRLSKFMTLILVAFVLTGCVREKIHMKIKKNGDVELSAIIAYASNAGISVTESEKEKYKKYGFKVENYEADDYKGVTITKKYKISEVSSDSPITFSLEELIENANPKIFQKTGSNTYKANIVLDASEPGYGGSGADISYTVTLPSKPISHNADTVEGNTLTWKIDLGQKKTINYEFSLSGSSNVLWIILGIVGVAAVAIIVVIVVMGKKNNNQNGMNQTGVGNVPTTPQNPVNPTVMPVSQVPTSIDVQQIATMEPTPVSSDVTVTEPVINEVKEESAVTSIPESAGSIPVAETVQPVIEESPIVPADTSTVSEEVLENTTQAVETSNSEMAIETSIEEKQSTEM